MPRKVDCTGCGRFIPGKNRVSVLERNIYLLMLGLDNSGKTCTAKALVGESLETVAPTIGFSKVATKYKGFNVTIFDLGGSKSFRGIWPKYFHEVHGFIFVVDASDSKRMDETSEVFQGILQDDKVKGKPILMLCNKADIDDAKDECHVVNALNVERYVNVARCPTRVEPSIATKNQGLKEGFKWLVKSIIANMSDLGPRVDRDVEEEQQRETERRADVRKRIEERKAQENGADQEAEDDDGGEEEPPGFVPITQLSAKLEAAEASVTAEAVEVKDEPDDTAVVDEPVAEVVEVNDVPEDTSPPAEASEVVEKSLEHPLKAPETLPPLVNGTSRRNSSSIKSNSSSRRNSHTNGMETFLKTGKLDLEPTNAGGNGLKKAPFGRRLSNTSKPTSSKSNSSAGSRK